MALQLSEDYPEILALIAQTVDTALRENDVAPGEAGEIAFKASEAVRLAIGGSTIYITQGMRWECSKRNVAIIEALAKLPCSDKGRYARVAAQFELSDRWIRMLETAWLESERARRQGRLVE